MAAAKKQCFLRFLYLSESSPQSFKVRGLQMTINLAGMNVGSREKVKSQLFWILILTKARSMIC